ncbi:hypothetical protein PITC_092030 [Penicillium italicum]|uniref:Uncharacterized protein n=1 Tax=Penicillium italicum TaxID=40296 RepID=A0A0A2LDF5_PENIT|nr:hypothetical protein PITC_092030 [Penicillium italicum]
MASSTSSQKSRTLLIPHKRALLSLRTNNPDHKVYKVLNPSALPAETSIKKSYEEVTQERNKSTSLSEHNKSTIEDEEDYEPQPPCFEVSFSMPPQPFLDPPTWEAMLKHSHVNLAAQPIKDELGSGEDREDESVEQMRQRMERETEYGSMAIRGRSSALIFMCYDELDAF